MFRRISSFISWLSGGLGAFALIVNAFCLVAICLAIAWLSGSIWLTIALLFFLVSWFIPLLVPFDKWRLVCRVVAVILAVLIAIFFVKSRYEISVVNKDSTLFMRDKEREIIRKSDFFKDVHGKIRYGEKLVEGERVLCKGKPIATSGEPLLRCMKKNLNGAFFNGDVGYIPLSATRLAKDVSPAKKSLREKESLQQEVERLRQQNSNLQREKDSQKAELEGKIAARDSTIVSLEKQLADQSATIGDLRAEVAQAQAARRTAEQAQRNVERKLEGAEAMIKLWKRRARNWPNQ